MATNTAAIVSRRRPLSVTDLALLIAHPKEVKLIAEGIGLRLDEALAAEAKMRGELTRDRVKLDAERKAFEKSMAPREAEARLSAETAEARSLRAVAQQASATQALAALASAEAESVERIRQDKGESDTRNRGLDAIAKRLDKEEAAIEAREQAVTERERRMHEAQRALAPIMEG